MSGISPVSEGLPALSEEEIILRYHWIIGDFNFPPDLLPSGFEQVKKQLKRPEVRALEGEERNGYAVKTYFDWADPKVFFTGYAC